MFPIIGDGDVVAHARVVEVVVAGLLINVAWRGVPRRRHIAVAHLVQATQPSMVLQFGISQCLRTTPPVPLRHHSDSCVLDAVSVN